MTVLFSCMTSGTPKSFSEISRSIVWLQACDVIRPRLWCCHLDPGRRLPSLYDWNCNNWVSRLWEILGEPNCLEFTLVHSSVILTVFSTYSLICRLNVHYWLIELVLFAARCYFMANYFAYFVVFGQRLPCISYWVSRSVQYLDSRFLCKFKSTIALSKDWWFLPQNLRSFLTSVKDTMHSLQVHMLCKLILAARTHSAKGVSTWVEPEN